MNAAAKQPLTGTVAFRATEAMVVAIEEHRRLRELRKFSDAARELLERGIEADEVADLAGELRRLGGNPRAELCAAIDDLARLAAMEKTPAAQPASR